jgi:lipopolysaccharide/colanic/teichoic acid biosynthesis glycosyltransferase
MLFELSRRTEQALSVISVEIGADPAKGRADLAHVDHVVADAVRRTDVVVRWGDALDIGHYGLFCPFTDARGAKDLIQRLGAIVAPRPLRGGVASFPLDGFALDDLIDLALLEACGPHDLGAIEKTEATVIRKSVASRLDRGLERRAAARAKRAFDLAFTVFTAPIWLPVIALVALALKITAPRAPVLFPQERTGRRGYRFRMYKFRTMVPNAEELKSTYAHLNQLKWPDFKIENDPRVTRIGRLLRKTSLDELPQIFNVLRGEMSWVGPRPTSFGPETYAIWQTARLDVMPGITGLWQVTGRGCTELEERLRLDMEYIDRRSLWYDLTILFRTVGEVLQPRGSI